MHLQRPEAGQTGLKTGSLLPQGKNSQLCPSWEHVSAPEILMSFCRIEFCWLGRVGHPAQATASQGQLSIREAFPGIVPGLGMGLAQVSHPGIWCMFLVGLGTSEALSPSPSPTTELFRRQKRNALSLRVMMGCRRRNFGVRGKI